MNRLPLTDIPLTSWIVWVALLGEAVIALFSGSLSTALIALGTFALTLLPVLFAVRFAFHIPRRFVGIIVVFIFASLFLGEFTDYYEAFWWWDVMLHGISALALGLIGFLVMFMLFQGDRYRAPALAMGMFAFCFALSIGALWELVEFSIDAQFGTDMQKSGLKDTMGDIFVDAIGAAMGALAGVIYLKHERLGPFSSILREVILRNRHTLFRRYRPEKLDDRDQ
nr:hypothetical protein [uncultured Celeribacter sp.]